MPLYPEIEHPETHTIKVGTPHQLYVEECGNPDGIAVLFLHGGPGSGCNANHRRYFNPDHYRIILFDQRGCGRSTPHGCLDNNTTQHLVEDMETIRQQLGVEKWILFAGSWGVCLALLYAQSHTKRVSGMILRGAFLASKRDLDWFFSDGVSRLYPELWDTLNNSLPALDNKVFNQETLLQTYHRCLFSADSKLNKKAAKAWSDWTNAIVAWTLSSETSSPSSLQEQSPSDLGSETYQDISAHQIRSIRLEVHYALNQYFLKDNQLLDNMQAIKHLPTFLIHGRKDITCPVESTWRLHKKFTNATLKILPNAGHLAGEPDMIEALVDATDRMITEVSRC